MRVNPTTTTTTENIIYNTELQKQELKSLLQAIYMRDFMYVQGPSKTEIRIARTWDGRLDTYYNTQAHKSTITHGTRAPAHPRGGTNRECGKKAIVILAVALSSRIRDHFNKQSVPQ